jgi:hypothetical protein
MVVEMVGPLDAGAVVAPSDSGWDVARQAFNLAVDQQPALVVYPETAEQVAAAVGFARERGLRVAPQRTGHAAEALPSLADTLLLRTDRMRAVEVDPAARTVRAAGGANWGDVVAATAPHGLAPIAGSSPNVGIAGFHLGGGLGFLSRRHGLAANSLTAIELVTADGRQVRATADSEPELFWALRGGGGNFGVVTALELNLFPVPDLYGGTLFFPIERAGEVFEAWRQLTLVAPEDLTLCARLLQIPDIDGPPPALRGRSFALVDVIFLGGETAGAELIAPVRALGPELDTVAAVGPEALGTLHMDPEDPVPALDDHMLLGPLSPEAVEGFVVAAGPDSGSSLVVAELRQIGGAMSREAPGGGALSARSRHSPATTSSSASAR